MTWAGNRREKRESELSDGVGDADVDYPNIALSQR